VAPTITILDDYQQVATELADWTALASRYHIDAVPDHLTADDLVRRLSETDIVVAMRERTPITAQLLDQVPRLRLIVTTGMRNASIDMDAARARGILVCGTRTRPSGVSELVIGILLSLMRSITAEDEAMHRGGWQHTVGHGLEGSMLGLIGLGSIGSRVAQLARAFDMDVVAWTPHLTADRARELGVRAVARDDLLASADAVSLHVPLNESTRGLIGSRELQLMKPSAYLINTSRGPIVDEVALTRALNSSQIAGAGLDVYDTEPLPHDHPLRGMSNALLLPHIGYVTEQAYRLYFQDAVEDIEAFLEGEPVRALWS
jgi:phosphoglycerate dehydrogenase-like enzyme